MKNLLVLVVLFTAGCASLTGDVDSVRITEYGVSGFFTGSAVGGCEVQRAESAASAAGKGSVVIAIKYRGEKCAVDAYSK